MSEFQSIQNYGIPGFRICFRHGSKMPNSINNCIANILNKHKLYNNTNNTKINENQNNILSNVNSNTANILNKYKHLYNKFKNNSQMKRKKAKIIQNKYCLIFLILEKLQKNTGGKDNHTGDFIIKDSGIEISIENKCYVNNVPKIELDKFKSDTTNNNCCGILLSQTSGIANKSDFEKEICNNNIL